MVQVDTCQAETMVDHVSGPNVMTLTSSKRGENSYALYGDDVVGVSTIDRFTAAAVTFLARSASFPERSLRDLASSLHPHQLHSHPTLGNHNVSRASVPLSEFFGAPARVVVPAQQLRPTSSEGSELPLDRLNERVRSLGWRREPSAVPLQGSLYFPVRRRDAGFSVYGSAFVLVGLTALMALTYAATQG
jgi:hypothetical protein